MIGVSESPRTDNRAVVGVLVLGILLLYTACFGPLPQDWFPLHIAGALARHGQWEAVYLPPQAQSLFEVTPAFTKTAVAEVPASAFDPRVVTAYLSPPPTAVLMMPFAGHWRISAVCLRLLIAGAMLLALGIALRADTRPWWVGALALSPLLGYTVYLGQTSGLLLLPAMMAVLPSTKGRDALGGVALGLTILTKATPVIAAVGFLLMGRRRLGIMALATAAGIALLTLPATGIQPWFDFWHSASRLSGIVIDGWNNVSLDAGLVRFSQPASDWQWFTLSPAQHRVTLLARVALLIGAAIGLQRKAPSAPWIAWLAATPVLWDFYLVVLLPAIVCMELPWLALAISVPVIFRYLELVNDTASGQLGTLVWGLMAVLLIRYTTPYGRRPDVSDLPRVT